jgi:hypothetical protein
MFVKKERKLRKKFANITHKNILACPWDTDIGHVGGMGFPVPFELGFHNPKCYRQSEAVFLVVCDPSVNEL